MAKKSGDPKQIQTIIRIWCAYEPYPYTAIDPQALALLEDVGSRLASTHRLAVRKLLRLLECFLQITDQQVSAQTLSSMDFVPIYRMFVGAISSDRLIDRPKAWKGYMVRGLNVLLCSVHEKQRKIVPFPFVTHGHSTIGPEIQSCIDAFSRRPLNKEMVWLWNGWVTEARSGRTINLPLYPLFKRMGKEFTEKLFNACDVYCRARRGYGLAGLKEFAQFIGEYPNALKPADFKNPQFTTAFWRKFLAFYMVKGYAGGSGQRISSLIGTWRKRVVSLARDVLQPSGLFAAPYGEFPSPEPRYVPGSRTHIKSTEAGHEVNVKLLTDVPLHVSDGEALELLFSKIQSDHDFFVEWAKSAADDTWQCYQLQRSLASQGTARKLHRLGTAYSNQQWLTDRSNPQHLANAAATFRHRGYEPNGRSTLQHLYPTPLSQTARELGFPVTSALLPHCIILVAEHPEITPSFLENLELFDRNGDRCGFVSTDGGPQLVGYKFRKGARLAEQKVALTQRTAAIVEQIIALTQSVRDFLKSERNDSWRYLLLSCAKGFAYPTRVRYLCTTEQNHSSFNAFVDRLGQTSMLSHEERVVLAKRFSLAALRSSAAVLVYLRTGSVEAMSKALGHATYNHRLLSSYLPEPIAAFFQDRWIRIFQTGVVVTALEGSRFLLEASAFESMDELDEFLRNHALKLPAKPPTDGEYAEHHADPTAYNSRVVFGVNTSILAALISLQAAVSKSVRQVSAKARYWSGIAERLIAVVESELNTRPDLQGYLAQARLEADPSSMERLLYA